MEERYPARPDTWDAIDGLGRMLPTHAQTGSPREGRYVGLFYWTWHNSPGGQAHNITDIVAAAPDAAREWTHPAWTGVPGGHWNEPVFGYYKTFDRWVLRKHAELLANAGVDVVIFDNTNGTATWEESYLALAETFAQARRDGVNAPGMAFLLPLHMGDRERNNENCRLQLRSIYQRLYQPGLYRELWFHWKGKPLVLAYPDGLDPVDPLEEEIRRFFTFRPVQPSYTRGQERPDHWGWLSIYPQQVYRNPDGSAEQMAVGVAQNHSERIGLTAMNNDHVFGRSYTSKGFDPRPDAKLWGANLAEQFEYALQVDPEFVFITGWNEWTAGRYESWCQTPNAFPDEYDDLNSRDCEPARGDLKDHYYYQMCAYVRRFKGTSPPMEAAPPGALTLASGRQAWDQAGVAFGDYGGNTGHRDEVGYGIRYVDTTGRNDIVWSKVAHTDRAILITVACRQELSPRTDPHWMRLYLRSRILAPTWEGFHFVVNRLNPTDGAVLEQSRGGWSWAAVARIGYRVDGNRLTVEVPRAPLGCDTPEFRVWFKWSDNTQADGDIMDFYSSGDTAPGGRFMYCYHGRDAAASPATSAGGRR